MARKQTRSMPKAWARSAPAQHALGRTGRVGSARRSSRTAAIALVLVVVAIVAALVLDAQSRSSADANRTDRRVTALLAGIPQEGRTLGDRLAPVTLQLSGDLEDVDTRRWVVRFLPAIVNEFVRPGILKIEYRSFKTNTLDPKAFVKQQTAAVASGAQNRLWNYIETFYYEQGREYTPYATETYLDGIAQQIPGLDIALWRQDRNDGRRTEQVVADDQEGRADGIHTTPAYRLGRTGDKLRNITGSEATVFAKQTHITSWLSAKDLATAIGKIH